VALVGSIPGENLRDDSWSLEAFYNYEINPWLHVTPNFQYAQNEQSGDDPAVILGVRLVIDI
jgi:carbohydrate-selective porin OprB